MGSSLVLQLGALGRLFEKSLSQLGSGGPSDHPSFGGVINLLPSMAVFSLEVQPNSACGHSPRCEPRADTLTLRERRSRTSDRHGGGGVLVYFTVDSMA